MKIPSGTYYFKDRDHAGRICYRLVLDGAVIRSVRTAREAAAWYRSVTETA